MGEPQDAGDRPPLAGAIPLDGGGDAPLSKIQMPWPVPDWSAYLRGEAEEDVAAIRLRTRTGRPWGSVSFIKQFESQLGRILRPRKPGPKPRKTRRKT